MEQVKLDQIVINECSIIIHEFSLAITVYNKFEEIWKQLGITDR